MRTVLIALLASAAWSASGQGLYQTVRGRVIDMDTKDVLTGASVVLMGSDPLYGTITDANGVFRLEKVPVGRQSVEVSYLGYHPSILRDIVVGSAREIVLLIELEERVSRVEEVTVVGRDKRGPVNTMSSVSARTFTMEETRRYAGALMDPARMAGNYAGIAQVNDERNDLVIRGNSPMTLLWRMEGVPIPNPNHFSSSSATGGGISILSHNNLAASDFLTGAFPAEYGNTIGGAFDLLLRSGNNEEREYIAQASFAGLELGAEGPLVKSGGSYMASYRYSTVGLAHKLKIMDEEDIPAIPVYQDGTFRIDLPAGKMGKISLFGIGGTSRVKLIAGNENEENFESEGKDYLTYSDMAVLGLSQLARLPGSSYLKTVIALTRQKTSLVTDTVVGNDERMLLRDNNSLDLNLVISSVLNSKINAGNSLRAGIMMENRISVYTDSAWQSQTGSYDRMIGQDGSDILLQGFFQWLLKFSDRINLSAGLHAQYHDLGGHFTLEPRLGMKLDAGRGNMFSLGTGLHSQVNPRVFYYYRTEVLPGEERETNKRLDLSRSFHAVLGHDLNIGLNSRMKTELYYQYLFSIPVEQNPSLFSMMNVGAEFTMPFVDSLVNEGTGVNYGLEFTAEKFFSHGYYFLLTASWYDSKYRGSDGVLRNSLYNGNYTFSLLGGTEIRLGKNRFLVLDGKISVLGNKRYIPVDLEASIAKGAPVLINHRAFTRRYRDYFRADLKTGLRLEKKNVSHSLVLDYRNVLNLKNILYRAYDPSAQQMVTVYQWSNLPMLYYRIEF